MSCGDRAANSDSSSSRAAVCLVFGIVQPAECGQTPPRLYVYK